MANLSIAIDDFPGGGNGFELVSRFCYNNGGIPISISNVSILYCAAMYLKMSEKVKSCNLLQQVETFLEGMFYWCWGDVLICLRSCELFFSCADSCGLIDRLVTTLLAKIAQNSDISLICSSNSSSSSSPENAISRRFRHSGTSTTSNSNPNNNNNKAWWFDDLGTLSPMNIEKVIRSLGAYGSDNNSLLLTKFLLHYLKTAPQCKKQNMSSNFSRLDYSGLADTTVYGVILMGKTAFSCRGVFWVLRLVSGFGLSKVCRTGLEQLIGSMLDLAKLDDLLVSGHNIEGDGSVYDVNLVVRLVRVFVQCEGISIQRLKKVGWLIDQYLAEISPDHNLKISKFIGVAQSLPDLARDSFDGVYRAIDIYLESHPTLSFEERSRLCRCLNYEKLSLEACKELAKNPRIPPRVAVQALASQKHVNYEPPTKTDQLEYYCESPQTPCKNNSNNKTNKQIVIYGSKGGANLEDEKDHEDDDDSSCNFSQGSEDMRLNIQRMQWRVLELEKLCKDMKGQMTKLVRYNNSNNKSFNSPAYNRPPRLC